MFSQFRFRQRMDGLSWGRRKKKPHLRVEELNLDVGIRSTSDIHLLQLPRLKNGNWKENGTMNAFYIQAISYLKKRTFLMGIVSNAMHPRRHFVKHSCILTKRRQSLKQNSSALNDLLQVKILPKSQSSQPRTQIANAETL